MRMLLQWYKLVSCCLYLLIKLLANLLQDRSPSRRWAYRTGHSSCPGFGTMHILSRFYGVFWSLEQPWGSSHLLVSKTKWVGFISPHSSSTPIYIPESMIVTFVTLTIRFFCTISRMISLSVLV